MPISPFINAKLQSIAKSVGKSGTSVANVKNTAKYALLQAAYWTLNRPDAIVGYIPLYTSQNYEVSRSHDILKYRAIRGEFMAHQKGGNIALRIDFTLQNDVYQAPTLMALQVAHLQGIEDKVPYNVDNSAATAAMASANTLYLTQTSVIQETKTAAYLKANKAKDNTITYDINDYSFLEGKTHKTMPIFLKDEVLFDMYIETLIYSRNTKEGAGIINGSMLLRHYVPPPIPKTVNIRSFINPGVTREKQNNGTWVYFPAETTTLKWEVEFEPQDETTGGFNIGINALHRGIMTAADYVNKPIELSRYESNRMTERGLTIVKAVNPSFGTTKEIKSFSANVKAQVYPFDPNASYKSAEAPSITYTNLIGDFSRLYITSDTTYVLDSGPINYKLYKTKLETLVESSQLVVSYNNGSKDCQCILGWNGKKFSINDTDGITLEQPLYINNNYGIVLGSARKVLLLIEYTSNGLEISRLST